ncbi:MAG: DUF4980 domain-containing protein [Bacteroidales bacterium]|nr:DUF4980 domain-containing protein [Bacteroidales bacterium]
MKILLTGALLALISFTAKAQEMKIEQMANDNALIRIAPNAKSKYILLPIEEKAPEAAMKVICNNMQQRTLYIRLALTKVDYYVPFELSEYQGKNLVLQTHLNIDRSNGRGAKSEICWENIKLSDTFDTANKEKFRPEFHHTPVYAWMNDPNGMFYLNGEWHLYYQYGPYGSMWNNMTWGHSVTRDLIHWEHRPSAIFPDAHGSIFSGSCVVDHENTAGFGKDAVIALYTSAGDVQSQSLAYSLDGGNTFTKYDGNPILTSDIPDFRDPNMFWNEDIKAWNLILACGQEMRLYSSPNLIDWTEESRFGQGLGNHEGVWECPDLMKLPVEGTNESKWVLICNINPGGPAGGSATQYFVGDFDGHKFTVDNTSRYLNGNALWQDYGMDHYATVSFSNAPEGRHTMIAWMSNWLYANDVPTMQFRSANSITREPYLYKVGNELFMGSRPSPEYDNSSLDKVLKVKGNTTVTLSNDEGEEFIITYDQKAMTLTCDRSKSGITNFNQHFASKPVVAPVHKKLTQLRVFVDNSSVEVFGNNGEVCLTNLVFPKSKFNHISVK